MVVVFLFCVFTVVLNYAQTNRNVDFVSRNYSEYLNLVGIKRNCIFSTDYYAHERPLFEDYASHAAPECKECHTLPASGLYTSNLSLLAVSRCRRRFSSFYCPRPTRCIHAFVTALLLLLEGVKVNPGPAASTHHPIAFGSLMFPVPLARWLSFIKLYWITTSMSLLCASRGYMRIPPNTIKRELAPVGFRVHRQSALGQAHGGGLAIVHRKELTVHRRSSKQTFLTLDVQVVNI